jgi:hypothetical protein
VSLAGFTDITDAFMDANNAAWAAEDESWANSDDYKLDGYTLFFEMSLSDTNAAAICVQKGLVDTDEDYTCFAVNYDSSESPKIVERFTDTITDETNYIEDSVENQSPTYS